MIDMTLFVPILFIILIFSLFLPAILINKVLKYFNVKRGIESSEHQKKSKYNKRTIDEQRFNMKKFFLNKIAVIIACGVLLAFGYNILCNIAHAEETPVNYSVCEKDLIVYIREYSFSELFGIENYNPKAFDNLNIIKYFQEKKYNEVIKLINEEMTGVEMLPDYPGCYTSSKSVTHYMVKAASYEALGKTNEALSEINKAQQEYTSAILYFAKLVLDVKLNKKLDIIEDLDRIKNKTVLDKTRFYAYRSLPAEDPINSLMTTEINIRLDFADKIESIKKCNVSVN